MQAIARDGVDELGLFEHGGFSEIYWFTLNENCPVPTGLKADPRYAKVDFSWNRVVGATGYMLACRPKTSKDIYEWSEVQSYGERMTLAQLKPGWTYEWRVGTLCTGDKPIYSAIQEVTLPKSNVDLLRDCGKEPPRPNLSPDPALDIQVGDTVTIGGDYPMVITQLQGLGDGWYSGRGTTRLRSIIELPRVALRFDRLRINIEKCQIDGLVEAIYADQPGGIADLDKIDDGGKRVQPSKLRIRERKVDFALGEMPEMSFDPETGELEMTDAEGKLQRIKLDLPEGGASASAFPMIITDSKGDSYQLSPDESSEVSSSGASSSTSSTEGRVGTKQGIKVERVERIGSFDASRLAHGIGTVRFEPSAQARYAFDSGTESWYQSSVKLDEYYKPFAKDYIAPWKLIPTGEQDVVAARYEGKKSIDLSRVRFATSPNSPTLPAELHEESKTWSLKLPGADAQSSYDVYAIYEGQVIGKLRVVSYPKQSYRVRLVSVNGQRVGDVSELSQHLNNIYQQVGVEFRLAETDSFQAELSNGHIRQDLKKLRDSYEEQHPLGGDEVCVFVLSSELSKSSKLEDVEGLMPRKSRFGYIFTGNSPNGKSLARTLAHELGHGLFTLQHSFDDEYGGKQSKDETANLMDYTVGATKLVAFQWNIISNPAPFTALDREKDIRFASGAVLTPNLDLTRVDRTSTLYVSNTYRNKLVQGTLPGFVLPLSGGTEEYYAWDGSSYRSTSSGESYTIESGAYTDVPIYLFYNLDKDCGKKAYVVVSYSDLSEVLKLKKNGQIDAARRVLLRLIHEKESSSKVVACIVGSEDPVEGAWREQSVSLDCSAEDVVALQKSYQDALKTKLRGDIQELVSLLKQYCNEPCFFEHISIDVRLKILSKLIRSDIDDSVWEFSFGKLSLGDSFFLDKLVLSTPKQDRLRLLRDGFIANQGKWIEIIFNKSKGFFNNDVTIADILPLVTGLASWIKQYYKELNIPISLGTIQNIGHPDLNEYSYPIASITPICIGVPNDGSGVYYTQQSDSGYTYELSLRSAFEGRLDRGRAIVSQKFFGHLVGTYLTSPRESIPSERLFNTELNLNLFEPVILLASRDYSALGIKAGEEYVVPAFLAVIYQQLLNDKASWDKARSAGNYLAIGVAALASPYTGGGSWAVYTTIGAGFVAGIDEALKDGRLKLGSSTEYDAKHKDFYQAWENLYNTAMVADAVANAPQLVRAIRQVNLIYRVKQLCEISRAVNKKFFEYLSSLRSIKSEGFEKLYKQYEIIKLTTKIEAPFIFNPKIAPHISNALGKANLKRIIKLNAKAALEAITPAERSELQDLCRRYLPVPEPGEMLRKVITLADAKKYYLQYEGVPSVQKFIAKAKDYEVSSAKNMIEYLRLDYKGTGFKPNEGFAIIEFPYPGETKIMHPFEVPNILMDNPAPYTNTGMSGSSRTIIPEYYLSERISLPQGAQLTIYDQAGSQIRQYVLKIISNSEGQKQLTWHIK